MTDTTRTHEDEPGECQACGRTWEQCYALATCCGQCRHPAPPSDNPDVLSRLTDARIMLTKAEERATMLRDRRLELCREALDEGHEAVTVAEAAGYAHAPNMYRALREREGR